MVIVHSDRCEYFIKERKQEGAAVVMLTVWIHLVSKQGIHLLLLWPGVVQKITWNANRKKSDCNCNHECQTVTPLNGDFLSNRKLVSRLANVFKSTSIKISRIPIVQAKSDILASGVVYC